MANFLTKTQKFELLNELKLERTRRYADRIRVILLLDQGKTYKSIAEYLFIDEGSISNYCKRYFEGGLKALIADQYQGKRSFLTDDEISQLSLHLESNLYNNTKDILIYIKKKYNAIFTISGITKFLHRIGFSYKKAKPMPDKLDAFLQKKFLRKYRAIKGMGKVYFGDSTHPQYGTIVTNGWIKMGKDHPVLVHRNSDRLKLNINGAICVQDLDIIAREYDKVNADAICDLISAIKKKNSKEKRLYLVLDNASYNKSNKVRDFANSRRVTLIFLPPYSPNLNPIERLWRYFKKEQLYNKYYECFESFCKDARSFFKKIEKHKPHLKNLLTDNFEMLGT